MPSSVFRLLAYLSVHFQSGWLLAGEVARATVRRAHALLGARQAMAVAPTLALYRSALETRLIFESRQVACLRELTLDPTDSAILAWAQHSDLGESVYLCDLETLPAIMTYVGRHRYVVVCIDSRNFLAFTGHDAQAGAQADYDERSLPLLDIDDAMAMVANAIPESCSGLFNEFETDAKAEILGLHFDVCHVLFLRCQDSVEDTATWDRVRPGGRWSYGQGAGMVDDAWLEDDRECDGECEQNHYRYRYRSLAQCSSDELVALGDTCERAMRVVRLCGGDY